MHREKGVFKLLSMPWFYLLFARSISRKGLFARLIREYIQPFPGCRILDIGCGPASIVSHLPDSIGEYVGFDANPSYIEFAKKRWKGKKYCRFYCQDIDEVVMVDKGRYDRVLAIGVVHHLDDEDAFRLFSIANQALKQDGSLIAYDNVYVENQNWFARWVISKDRGKAVRTVGEYKKLAARHFGDLQGEVLHDVLKIPYTIFFMRCKKTKFSEL